MKLFLLDRFDGKYGEGAYDLLTKMLKDPLVSLTDVGEYFGFTRQRASIYFSNVFPDIGYTKCFPRERLIHRLRPKFWRFVYPIYAEGMDFLRGVGFSPHLLSYKNTNRVVVNLFVVCCCRLYPSRDKKTAHLMFSSGKRSGDRVDFYLCMLRGVGHTRGYLVPFDVMPKGGISIPTMINSRSKYAKYLNNFEALGSLSEGL